MAQNVYRADRPLVYNDMYFEEGEELVLPDSVKVKHAHLQLVRTIKQEKAKDDGTDGKTAK